MRGLRLYGHPSFLVKKSLLKPADYFFMQLSVFFRFFFLQYLCRFCKQPGRICIISRTDKTIRCRTKVTAFLRIQCHPVSKLQLIMPNMIFGMSAHEINPPLHTAILSVQYFPIPIHQVQSPRINDRHIGPCRSRMFSLTEKPVVGRTSFLNIRHHMRHTSFRRLVCCHIHKPFSIESIGIHQIARRTTEDLRISCPAQALIALRAVCGYIQKITFKAPQIVMMKLIQ